MSPVLESMPLYLKSVDARRFSEDGPAFRSTLGDFERMNSSARSRIRSVLKRSEAMVKTQVTYNAERELFMQSMKEALFSNPEAYVVLSGVLKNFELLQNENVANLEVTVIQKLRKLYEKCVKSADQKRKEFEDESKEWYQLQSKYLSKKETLDSHKRAEKDLRFKARRKHWDITRMEYFTFLEDLHGGRIEQEVLQIMTSYAKQQVATFDAIAKNIEGVKNDVMSLIHGYEIANQDFKLITHDRQVQRRELESPLTRHTNGNEQTSSSEMPRRKPIVSPTRSLSSPENKASSKSSTSPRKEGILYACSKPASHGDQKLVAMLNWHKYWVTLTENSLCEFSNWKTNMEQHNDPIRLNAATVREARNTERRFCFEIITPSMIRTYQTTSDVEVQAWISAVSKSIEACLLQQATPLAGLPPNSPPAKHNAGITPLNGKEGRRSWIFGSGSVGNFMRLNQNSTPPNTLPEALQEQYSSQPLRSLAENLTEISPSNGRCADCNSPENIDWAAINLGCLLCIECAGVHRSLGTHISKVRSLKLDSFSQHTMEILSSIGNEKANSIWQSTQLPSLEAIQSDKTTRADFIRRKYKEKEFLAPFAEDSQTSLFFAIDSGNIYNVLLSLANGASANAMREDGESAFTAALHEAARNQCDSFPIPEILLLHGASLRPSIEEIVLQFKGYESTLALNYLREVEARMERIN